MSRIYSLESLRGLLALWVVAGHTVKHSGYSPGELGSLAILANPGLAVDVFIILSGFVIFFLLDQQHTSYPEFIVRRWFRLAPAFLCVLLASSMTLAWQTELINGFPWKNGAVSNDLTIHLDSMRHYAVHLAMHLLMLHGVISDSILPSSQYAFVGQAWSISVEWQFYLVAPFLFRQIEKRYWNRVAILILLICVLRALSYGGEGFAIQQAAYFLVGIVSYYIWKHCHKTHVDPAFLDMVAVVVGATIYLLLNRTASLLIWILVLTTVVAEKRGLFSPMQRLLSVTLNTSILKYIGKISYSIYMTHMLLLYVSIQVVFTVFPNIGKPMFLATMLPSVVVLTIVVSALSYGLIERPGIQAGHRVARLLLSQRASQPG